MSSLWFSSPLCRITPTAAASPKTGRGASPSPGPAAPTAPTSSCPSWCSPAWPGSSPAHPTPRPSCSSSGGDTGVARGWVKPLGAPLGARRNWGNRGAGRKGLSGGLEGQITPMLSLVPSSSCCFYGVLAQGASLLLSSLHARGSPSSPFGPAALLLLLPTHG